MKKHIAIFTLIILALVSIPNVNFVSADNITSKLQDVNSKIQQVKANIKRGKQQSKNLSAEIYAIERKIGYTEQEISNLEESISETEAKIQTSNNNLMKMEESIKNQDDDLKKRLRAMYKNGSIKFVEVLLGSESVTDFMTNMDMVERIHKQDQDVLKSLRTQRQIIEEEKQNLEDLKNKLKISKENQSRKREELRLDEKTVKDKKQKIQLDLKQLEQRRKQFVEEANRLTAEILKSQSKGTIYSGGTMAWPVPGWSRITSKFGWRTLYGKKNFHTGTDIDCDTGTPIVAANSGTVLRSEYNTRGYGYYVVIDHGGGIVTVYAHNSKLLVKKGDKVERGQVISLGGSTGNSTGSHCHFEVRVNGKYKDPMKGWISK